jgi:hypothetical protein
MGWVLPEVSLKKIISSGIKELRLNKPAFLFLFEQYACSEMNDEYGPEYIEKIWTWFTTTKIPVIQSWSLNMQKYPCISIQLATESEDEGKAALYDLAVDAGEDGEIYTGVFTVMLDIGIHSDKADDQVLWLYYILSYILFKKKRMAERLGLKLHTFSASDYNRESKYLGENVWSRWIRFRCTTQNFLGGDEAFEIDGISTEISVGNEPASDVSASLDVDINSIDTTVNKGLRVSRIHDIDGDEDLNV